jgi:hypothetical protein
VHRKQEGGERNRDRDVLENEKCVLEEEKVHWEVRLSSILEQNLNPITSSIFGTKFVEARAAVVEPHGLTGPLGGQTA